VSDDTAGIIWRVRSPSASPAPGIARLVSEKLPPLRELKDPRKTFEEDYLRQQAGQKVN
jgi:hypothetical protein